jgi:hypothetical protein
MNLVKYDGQSDRDVLKSDAELIATDDEEVNI